MICRNRPEFVWYAHFDSWNLLVLLSRHAHLDQHGMVLFFNRYVQSPLDVVQVVYVAEFLVVDGNYQSVVFIRFHLPVLPDELVSGLSMDAYEVIFFVFGQSFKGLLSAIDQELDLSRLI